MHHHHRQQVVASCQAKSLVYSLVPVSTHHQVAEHLRRRLMTTRGPPVPATISSAPSSADDTPPSVFPEAMISPHVQYQSAGAAVGKAQLLQPNGHLLAPNARPPPGIMQHHSQPTLPGRNSPYIGAKPEYLSPTLSSRVDSGIQRQLHTAGSISTLEADAHVAVAYKQWHANVSILFADIVGYTALPQQVEPEQV